MLVSKNWLRELVDLKVSVEEVERLLPLRSIGTKEITSNFIELDMKGYNRADLLSMRGVAYEIAAITDSKVNFHEIDEADYAWTKKALPAIRVNLRDDKLCPFYCVAKIEGLKIGESDTKDVQKLTDSGMRAVNNIADTTNLVMLEYGQPLHAFDASKIAEEEIIVRRGEDGEKIITLDGTDRVLTNHDLVIADSKNALAIAGVMGGQNSMVSDSTSTILLEAAIFDPGNLRQTVSRLNLPSEASKRFYHGLTKVRLLQALDAAIRRYAALGGKLVAFTLVGDFPQEDLDIILRHQKVNSLIGVDLSTEEIEKNLMNLNFTLNKTGAEEWKVMPPYWRLDCEIEEDLIEEIARLHGYETIPAKELEGIKPEPISQELFGRNQQLKDKLVSLGLTELQTYSFWSTAVLDNLNMNRSQLVKIANPMSAETEYLRTELWPNLTEKAVENLKKFDDIAIFEIGKVYQPRVNEVPEESYRLSILVANNSDDPISELLAIVEKLELDIQVEPRGEALNEVFHPVRQAELSQKGQQVGVIAEVHPRSLRRFGTDQRLAIAEIDLATF